MPSNYILIPRHKILSEEEAKEVSKKFNIEISKFPKIFENDVQAKKLGAKPGQLIEISRKDGDVSYIYYRYVVS
ncbi:MAG: DNA-directed RNA polymerase subunit RpoH/Rpb5 C-terminal domain-containing protein [Candidatus Micrarchaeaceae archaeon]